MSSTPDLTRATWIKSSYSNGDGGDCLEWAPSAARTGTVPVRDSKDPHGPALLIPAAGWTSFITAVRDDELPS